MAPAAAPKWVATFHVSPKLCINFGKFLIAAKCHHRVIDRQHLRTVPGGHFKNITAMRQQRSKGHELVILSAYLALNTMAAERGCLILMHCF